MVKKTVTISGNAGFIMSHVADACLDLGYKVNGIDNFSGGKIENIDKRVNHCNHGCEHPNVHYFIEDNPPDILIYGAADATESRSQFTPIYCTTNNVMAYVNTLTASIKAGVKKVIFFSSMSVYGEQEPPFNESMKPDPVDVYGINKFACERITKTLSKVHGFKYTIIRPHNVFGERQRLDDPYRNVIGIWMNRIMQGKPPIIYGDGTQTRSFTHIDNFIPFMMKTLDDFDGETFNIGPEQEYSLNEAVRVVLEAMGSDLKPIHVEDRPLEVKHAECSADKARRLLGYKTLVSFEDGIKKMAKWAKSKGPQEFKYLDDLEIISKDTPKTWTKKII